MGARRSSRPRSGASWRIGVFVAATLACVLIVVSAVFDIRRQGRFPHDARTGLSPVNRALSPIKGPAADLAQAPLSGFPLWDASRAVAKSDPSRARALVLEALRRDPQLADARQWLAGDAVTQGRYGEAVRQIDWLFTLNKPARPQLAAALAALARLPQARPVLEQFADRKPIWLPAVTQELIKANADPAIAFRLLGGADVRSGSTAVGGSGLVAALVARRQYDAAYLAWVTALPQTALGAVGYIYDPAFHQLPGALPFNWNLIDSDQASVDFVPGGGVRISYFGDGPAHFIDQLLTLPPGRYRLMTMDNSLGTHEANKARWSIGCVDQGTPFGGVDVPVAAKPVATGVIFDVPAGCTAQRLSLDGTPAEFTAAAEIQIKAVALTRADGGA